MKRVTALFIVCTMLLLGSCSKEQEPESTSMYLDQYESDFEDLDEDFGVDMPDTPQGDDTITEPTTFEESPRLFTVKEAFERAFAFLGNTEAEVEEQLKEKYSLTIRGIKQALTGRTNINPDIARLLNDVTIPNEAVDWTTNNTYQNLELPGETIVIPIDVIKDTAEFVRYIDTYGLDDYLFLSSDADRAVNVDFNFMEQMLSTSYKPDDHLSASAGYDPNGNFRITLDGTNIPYKSYYSRTVKGKMTYVTYHPTILGDDGAGLYMKDESQYIGAPLWQCYFIYYAKLIMNNYGVDRKGIVNKTADGIEMWWGLSTGKTVELDVYPSGFIRILLTYDNFLDINDYEELTSQPEDDEEVSIYDTNYIILYNALAGQFDMSTQLWSEIVAFAKEIYSPLYVTMETEETLDGGQVPLWVEFIKKYKATIEQYVAQEAMPTILQYYKAVSDLEQVGQVDNIVVTIKDLYSSLEDKYRDEDESMRTALVNHPDWNEDFDNFVEGLRIIVGKPGPIELDTTWAQVEVEPPPAFTEESAETTAAPEDVPEESEEPSTETTTSADDVDQLEETTETEDDGEEVIVVEE